MAAKLQIALDDITLEDALSLLEKIHTFIDIAEIGTPFMMEYGMEAVRRIHAAFPELEILCDAKIMDAGKYESQMPLLAGADYVTVLGVTDDRTIQDVVTTAHENGNKKVVVDMICVNDLKTRAAKMEELGVDVIAVHTGVDQQAMGRTPLDDLRELSSCVKRASLAVAGGISPDTAADYLSYHPDIIIVGSGIVHAKSPVDAAEKLKSCIDKYNAGL